MKQVHRFVSDGDDFAVVLAVREFEEGNAILDKDDPVSLHQHRIEKKPASSGSGPGPGMPATTVVGRDKKQTPRAPWQTSASGTLFVSA